MSKNHPIRIDIAPTYEGTSLPHSDRIQTILRSALKARGLGHKKDPRSTVPYWDAKHFELHQSSHYRESGDETQNDILKMASQSILEESYFIEKSGMSFTAKMALLSESTEERMLYSLFSADETVHLNEILNHLDQAPDTQTVPPFVRFLSDLIRDGDRQSLVFLIQVVLEGWGITHYHELAKNCRNHAVRSSLQLILKDEARHHGSGMILSRANTLNLKQKKFVREAMVQFMHMVQCGPQNLVAAIEKKLGHLSKSQRIQIFGELNCVQSTHHRIVTLRSLLAQAEAHELIEDLEKADVLRPFSAQECAEIS